MYTEFFKDRFLLFAFCAQQNSSLPYIDTISNTRLITAEYSSEYTNEHAML